MRKIVSLNEFEIKILNELLKKAEGYTEIERKAVVDPLIKKLKKIGEE